MVYSESVKRQYTLQDFETLVKSGSFLYPYRTKYGWTSGSGWGSEDKTLEKSGLLNYQVSVAPPGLIPDSALRFPVEDASSKTTECSKVYFFSHLNFRDLTSGHRQPLKLKFGMPIGIYLGELISILDTKVVVAKILNLDGQIIWF